MNDKLLRAFKARLKFYNNGEVHPKTKANLLYLDIFGRPKPTDKETNNLMDIVLSRFNHSVNR